MGRDRWQMQGLGLGTPACPSRSAAADTPYTRLISGLINLSNLWSQLSARRPTGRRRSGQPSCRAGCQSLLSPEAPAREWGCAPAALQTARTDDLSGLLPSHSNVLLVFIPVRTLTLVLESLLELKLSLTRLLTLPSLRSPGRLTLPTSRSMLLLVLILWHSY